MSKIWRRSKLGKHVKIYSGNSPSQVPLAEAGAFPFLKVEDLNNCEKYQCAGRSFTDERQFCAPAGSVIFPKRGAAILNNKIRIASVDVAMDTNLMAVYPERGLDGEFLYYLIQQEGLFKIADTSTIPQLNNKHIIPYEFDLPPLPEQRKIAEILRTWDEAIEKLETLRVAKERRHRALTHSLVFGNRQLERFRTTNEVTGHRWFTLPASWGSKPIGKLAREISERNTDAEQHEVLSCSKYDGFVRSLEYFKKQVFSADLSGYKKIWRGDFGFPSNHVEEGSIGLQNLTDVGLVSPIYTVFRFTQKKVDTDYAFAVLKTELYRHIFEVSTSASVDRRGSLRWSEFSKLPFPVPSLTEQKAIAEVLQTSRTELTAITNQIERITRQKRGLMQKLLTGDWRVQTEANAEAAA